MDVADCPALDRRLRNAGRFVVVDLTDVSVLSAAVLGVLVAHAERLAGDDGRLVVTADNPTVQRLLRVTGTDHLLGTSAGEHPPATSPAADLHGNESVGLRRQLRSQLKIARATGILQERYGLTDEHAAFDVLRSSSQRHNVRLTTLATAFLSAPAPRRSRGENWFPGRRRDAAPPLTLTTERTDGNRTVVLDAVLDAVVACMGTEVVDLRLIEAGARTPTLARHRGHTSEFVEFVESSAQLGAVVAEAWRRRSRVVVADVATDPLLADPAERAMLLASGSRALQCGPLTTRTGVVVGMVSSHHANPGRTPTAAEHTRLDEITSEAGAWLDWHRRTIILDALEDVHRTGRAAAAARDPR
jgi:anti-anti-sigma factor